MSLLGSLLKNRRARESALAWNLPALAGPETLVLSSQAFADGSEIGDEHAGKLAGGYVGPAPGHRPSAAARGFPAP